MLTKRQIEILLNLFSNLDAPVSLQVFTDQFHLSLRSIQTDIAEIKETIKEHGLYIENNKNCICMSITNQETANIFMNSIIQDYNLNQFFEDQSSRISYIISRLLDSNDYLKSADLADEIKKDNEDEFADKREELWIKTGYRSVCGRSGIPFSLLEDRFQKGSQNLCRLPVAFCAGVLPGTYRFRCGVGQLQQINRVVSGNGFVLLRALSQHRQQLTAQHPDAPHQLCPGVLCPEQGQKMLHTVCHLLGVRRMEVSVGEPPQLVGLAGGRVCPWRVIECAGVVGA